MARFGEFGSLLCLGRRFSNCINKTPMQTHCSTRRSAQLEHCFSFDRILSRLIHQTWTRPGSPSVIARGGGQKRGQRLQRALMIEAWQSQWWLWLDTINRGQPPSGPPSIFLVSLVWIDTYAWLKSHGMENPNYGVFLSFEKNNFGRLHLFCRCNCRTKGD